MPSWPGPAWALALLVAWSVSLLLMLLHPLQATGAWSVIQPLLLVLLRTVLQTGLFIVAHDAMHGSLWPSSPRWNDRLGRLSLWLYACLPWEACRRKHRRHHQAPASPIDPDHHGIGRSSPLRWYGRFMASYLTPAQMGCLVGSWLLVLLLLPRMASFTVQMPERLLLFWILPLLLSSLQLFLFGTYLPHRIAPGRSDDRHRAASLCMPAPLSLLACYHFGYHWEHHRSPWLPWYRLPQSRLRMTVRSAVHDRLALAELRR